MAEICANMAGSVWKILVKQGDRVMEGRTVVILESMKMEIPILSDSQGIVKKIKINEGEFVNDGDVLVEVE